MADSIDYAKSIIRTVGSMGNRKHTYIRVDVLLKRSGLTKEQFQAGLHVLFGPSGKAAGWEVYTELPFAGNSVSVLTPSGAKVARIKLVKKEKNNGNESGK